MNMKRIIITLAAIAAAGACGWVSLGYSRAATPNVMTAEVRRGSVEQTVLATGTLKPSRLVAVGAQVSGRITGVNVSLGQTVKAGELVAEIDSVTQRNNLRTAQAALANVKAQRVEKEATRTLNQQSLARQQDMASKNTTSRSELESAAAALAVTDAQIKALDAQIEEAEVAVETAEANLGYTQITAPIDGTVLSIVSQEGQTVNATQSAPTIVIIGQLDTMTVRTEISEADITRVTAGLPVYFTVLGEPQTRYEATLAAIEPAPESIRSDSSFSSSSSTSTSSSSSSSSSEAIYYNGVFNVPNPDGKLRTYMTAEVHIVLGEARDVLTVPSAALGSASSDGKYAVRVMAADGSIAQKQVEVGLNDKVTAEIRSGLAENERVITGEATAAASSSASRGPGGPPPMGF
ncbi:efflux RND transporter periplasmic adaptor subunit [Agrobacterium larrymoorei]|uniref:Efflux RND transporter periplasmic adaptor subunit n=1 Tax=Agrobacterium larrymoorei TaxID=160699 RepID=A0A4D7DZ30_9HYPH|nr:efflux RND transporter periplasmic adaptor subunit [Agrobacterium larrymoorei]QCI99386.1 efflux RND transporter periplasmic adaptor subunit [Agrobacterium larrymoorei]QYA08928.1 efflux RND transporter periplasmic adaptor subunit [Agrobacterium larrymoorei]